MTSLNPKNLRLTKSAFEYDADPSIDLIEGSKVGLLKKLILESAKEHNFDQKDIKHLIDKLNSGGICHHICPDCDKDIFSNKSYIICPGCQQKMEVYSFGLSRFTCSNCSKSWEGFIYNDLCPNCR